MTVTNTHGVINWGLDTGDGESISAGYAGTRDHARAMARRVADSRGEAVYLYPITEGGDGGPETEEIEPTDPTSAIAAPR